MDILDVFTDGLGILWVDPQDNSEFVKVCTCLSYPSPYLELICVFVATKTMAATDSDGVKTVLVLTDNGKTLGLEGRHSKRLLARVKEIADLYGAEIRSGAIIVEVPVGAYRSAYVEVCLNLAQACATIAATMHLDRKRSLTKG